MKIEITKKKTSHEPDVRVSLRCNRNNNDVGRVDLQGWFVVKKYIEIDYYTVIEHW